MPAPATRRRTWLRVAVTTLGLALCAAVGTAAGLAVSPGRVPAAVWHDACEAGCWESVAAAPRPPSIRQPAATGPPSRVRIPRLHIDSALAVLGLDPAGELVPPANFGQAGWYGAGPAPGDVGPAVIAGHVDSRTGPAVFVRLHELRAGDRVEVLRGGVWVEFRVVSTTQHPKDEFPTGAVYGPTPDPQLRLVTCGGSFDRRARSYRDNIVVFAVADQPGPVLPTSAAG